MPKQVAVPDIFISKIDHLVDHGDRVAVRVNVHEAHCRAGGLGDIKQPDAIGKTKGRARRNGPQGNDRVLQGVHPQRVFPAQFIGVWRFHLTIPPNAVDQLHIKQMKVNRVGIHPVMGDLPDLGAIARCWCQRRD